MGADESLGFGKASGEVDRDRQPDQCNHIDPTPSRITKVGKRQGCHGNTGTQPVGEGEKANRMRPRVARHLFGRNHGDQEINGESQRPPDGLRGDEQAEIRRECAQCCDGRR
jgi:hypothetical protein